MARIVLNTFGSLGDLNPYLALAIGLRRRGHRPVIATSEVYREKVQAEGVEFHAVRPDVGEFRYRPELNQKLCDPRHGSEFLLRDYILPRLDQTYEDLLAIAPGAGLFLTHAAGYAGPIVADALNIPWLSVALQPMVFFSAYDPPVIPGLTAARHLYRLGPWILRSLLRAGSRRLDRWAEPIANLRARLALPRNRANPLTRGQFSNLGTLALFSRAYAAPQPDWPPNVRVTGFVFYDRRGALPERPEEPGQIRELATRLEHFLADGAPPVLFTLGSSAVMQAGNFFRESLAAVRKLGIRAVLLTGDETAEQPSTPLPDSIFATDYLPFSQIMPKAAAVVHQGGIGTTAQVLRAAKPMIVVPWAHDQPDNAERLRKLGVSRTISRTRYTADRVAKELSLLLSGENYQARATQIGRHIASEDGLTAACDAIEDFLRTVPGRIE